MNILQLPSGYLTVRHGKSPFLIGKPSISMGHFPWLDFIMTQQGKTPVASVLKHWTRMPRSKLIIHYVANDG
jgi:hypothetical protein